MSAFAADLPLPPDPEPMAPAATTLPLPAVSGPNGKVSLLGGAVDSDIVDGEFWGAEGSFSIPISTRFGMQGDAFATSVSGELVAGGAAHFFWRDPSVGLIGAYGGGAVNNAADFDAIRGGLEAEAYLGNISLEGLLGWEHREFDIGGDDDSIFALADIAFYATDDLRLSAGYRHWNDTHMAAFGAEYQLPMQWGGNAASLYAEGRVGEDDYRAVWGGLRLYFGAEPKSLIRRHREDDPRSRLEDQAGVSPQMGGYEPMCDEGYVYLPPEGEFSGGCDLIEDPIPEENL